MEVNAFSATELSASRERVQALLGAIKTEPAAIGTEQTRLWAARRKWSKEPLQFVVWRRIAVNFYGLQQPDSLYHYMHRARHAARGIEKRYPLEMSSMMGLLGDYHWARQNYDSATFYYRQQLHLLAGAGQDTLARRGIRLLDDTVQVGQMMARAAANTGLGLRRHGDLVVPVRYYERALRLFEGIDHALGRLWVLALLGETYEEQGNDERAAYYYDRALVFTRQTRRTAPHTALAQWAELLTYNHRLLLRHGKATELEALAREGEALLPTALKIRDSHPWECYGPAAMLAVRAVEADLTGGRPAAAALALADERLRDLYRVTADHRHLRAPHFYYEMRAEYEGLRAWAGPSSIRSGAVVRAIAYCDSVSSADSRRRVSLLVANYLLRAGQPAAALALLREDVRAYRADIPRLRDVYAQQADAYAALGRYDSAFVIGQRASALTDTLRTARQYAALADMETHYRTQQKEAQIGRLQSEAEAQRRRQWLAWLSAAVLAVGLLALGYSLRTSRRLNQALARQRARVQEQADRLAEIDRARSQFFANISHELRTPLTLVVGPVESVLRKTSLTPDDRRQLTLTLRNGRRLQRLVNNILDLTKLEANKLTIQARPIPVVKMFRVLVASFESAARQQQITLTSQIDLPDSLVLMLDAEKVEQVVTNLLSNALKHTSRGGVITLRAAAEQEGRWLVQVNDTGVGIAPEEQERVFERFYQSLQRQAQGGTGIGLALARELAELMGGSLTLVSAVGEGSTFTFRFQAEVSQEMLGVVSELRLTSLEETAEETAQPVDLPSTGQLSASATKVLVVEDNPDLREYLRGILGEHFLIREAENGRQALEILATEEIDLISSDEMMPEMTGTELLLHLRQQANGPRIPFLMLTARADEEHKLNTLEIGVDDYLQKPFSPRELLARVNNLLMNYQERRRWLAAPADTIVPEAEAEVTELPESPMTPEPANDISAAPVAETVSIAEPGVVAGQQLMVQLRAAIPQALENPDFGPVELSVSLGLSERSLYRRLKELTGLTPAGWLREVRLDHARRLLESRATRTVAEVAYAAGFNNADYFGQLYLKRYGKLPSEYLYSSEE